MKKINALILAAALSASAVAQAQTDTVNTAAYSPGVTDTLTTTSTIVTDITPLDESEPSETPVVAITDGKWTVDYAGDRYELTEMAEAVAEKNSIGFDEDKVPGKMVKNIPAILAIIFGIPCLTIIVGLIVILVYSLRRNRSRNELINNAIEHDYQLPDSFYCNQKSAPAPGAPVRDSRRFYRAISLLAVGLALIFVAASEDIPFFWVAGGIPFLIGIGQMIGYFCIPSTDRPYFPGPGNYPQRPNGPVPPYAPQQGYPSGQPRFVPGQPEPVYPQYPAQSYPVQSAPVQPAEQAPAEPCAPVTPTPYNPEAGKDDREL